MSDISLILEKQREYFLSGETYDINFRINMLKKLYSAIKENEAKITEALKADLGKSNFEAYMCEVGLTLSEISYLIKNIKRLARDKRVKTPLAQFKSKSYIKSVPFGNTLIMSPWNYPFLLTIEPLCSAIAAGNTVVLKPSAYSPHTSELVKNIASEVFEEKYVAVVTGGRKENAELLKQKFDFVFFTGSQAVGREVLRHCSENLCPSVLELGGKSPCIVDETANIELAARRIVFGKYLNLGQTCVAPDYVLCHSSVKLRFVEAVMREIKAQFGDNVLENADYGRIINEKHFDRLLGLIDGKKVIFGGKSNRATLKIEPTVMDNVTLNDAVMGEELFGPIMPVISYDNDSEVYSIIRSMSKPLALYLFSENKARICELTGKIQYGGGCVNDTIIHLATSEMPFGGIGESGMGGYHGKFGFDTFSHKKSIVDKKTWLDLPMRYQPYDAKKFNLIKMFLK